MSNHKRIVCVAVDDEPPALAVLQEYIKTLPGLELAGLCKNAVEALTTLQERHIDLLFLDIQMPQLLGTDFIRTLKNPPKVIFTTAYRKFAVEGFELNAVDYLLKPISFERFLRAVNKVMDTQFTAAELPGSENQKSIVDQHLYLRAQRRMTKIPFDEILYVESLKDYVKVVSQTTNIISKLSISALEETLPKNRFVRVHRSFIVALDKVTSYSSDMVEIGKTRFPISRMYRHEVAQLMSQRPHMNHRLLKVQ
jgi:DNA-binding LytR/AlgR family response regulator